MKLKQLQTHGTVDACDSTREISRYTFFWLKRLFERRGSLTTLQLETHFWPFLGANLLEFSIGRDLGALKGSTYYYY